MSGQLQHLPIAAPALAPAVIGPAGEPACELPVAVVAAMPPLLVGAAPFNAAMVRALRTVAPTQVLSWRRPYPPVLYRGKLREDGAPAGDPAVQELLDWADPRTWRRALRRMDEQGARALVLPWLHPVMTPPYRYLLRHAPRDMARVVVCHNVEMHERTPLAHRLTRAVLRHADVLVTHAPQQRDELAALGIGGKRVLEAYHPRFVADDLAGVPTRAEVGAVRARYGNPRLLLVAFGAVRPYKGVDLAIEALRHVPAELDVRLVVAGRFWKGGDALAQQVAALGLGERVVLDDRFVPDDEVAALLSAADAAVLPYRSATQSGVVQLAFAYGCPVIATRVGGLTAAVRDGHDGLLVPPEDPRALAWAMVRASYQAAALRSRVDPNPWAHSFERYAELILQGVREAIGVPALAPAAAPASTPALALPLTSSAAVPAQEAA